MSCRRTSAHTHLCVALLHKDQADPGVTDRGRASPLECAEAAYWPKRSWRGRPKGLRKGRRKGFEKEIAQGHPRSGPAIVEEIRACPPREAGQPTLLWKVQEILLPILAWLFQSPGLCVLQSSQSGIDAATAGNGSDLAAALSEQAVTGKQSAFCQDSEQLRTISWQSVVAETPFSDESESEDPNLLGDPILRAAFQRVRNGIGEDKVAVATTAPIESADAGMMQPP